MACCGCIRPPCGGFEYAGGCGPKPRCRPLCCPCKPPRTCQKLCPCHLCPPAGFPCPPLCYCPPCGDCRSSFPPFACEPHPCYPINCRRVPKCSEWPCCPWGRPSYKPLGPPKLCYRPICCPPCPDCPLPKASPIPCYPRLFKNCQYYPLEPAPPCYLEGPPLVVRDVQPPPLPKCTLPRCCC